MVVIKLQNRSLNESSHSFASVAMRRIIHLVVFSLLGLLFLFGAAHQLSADELEGSDNAAPWLLPRGNSQSSGYTPSEVASSPSILWEVKLDEAIETTPVVGFGKVFTADVFGKIYALDQKTGEVKWKRDYETGFLASPSLNDGKVVIGDVEGNVYALNTDDGKEIWRSETGGEINGSAGFFEETVVIASQDGKLYCFSLGDGTLQWTYQTEDQVRCSPSIAGRQTFLGGCDGQLHQVDLKTGMTIGKPLPLGGPTGSTPAISGSKVVLPIMDGAVLAFDWKKQEQLWLYEDTERPMEYRSSAAISDDLVVVSSQSKQVDALSLETGKLRWRYNLKRRADASPVIAGGDVWIAATDGRLIRLSLASGEEKWSYEIRGSFIAAPAIFGSRLFIGDDDGVLRCFGDATVRGS